MRVATVLISGKVFFESGERVRITYNNGRMTTGVIRYFGRVSNSFDDEGIRLENEIAYFEKIKKIQLCKD